MESYAQQADPVNASSGVLWSGNSIVDCSAQDSNGNNCCAANINTNYKIAPVNDRTGNPPAPWTQNTFPNMCRQFLGAFMSYQNENSTKFPKFDNSGGKYPTNWVYNPIGVTISAAPPGCCAYAETYATPQICGNADTVSGVLDVLRSSNIQLCYWSGSFGNIHSRNVAVGGTQTFQQSCRPLTLEEQFIIAGDYKGGCYDWSAKKQDIIADAAWTTCPRYGASVTASYTSPLSRFNSKSTFPYQPLDVLCCADFPGAVDCPATACFENPYCGDLLYSFCSNILANPGSAQPPLSPSDAEALCASWQAFGIQQTTANQNGQYKTTADVAARVPIDYCHSVNYTDIANCAGIGALEGFLYDRLTPDLSVNILHPGSLTTILQVRNASGRSVSNVNVITQTPDSPPTLLVNPSTLSFDPWGTQTLTVTYNGDTTKAYLYSYSDTHSVAVAGVNVTPNGLCSISLANERQFPRLPLPSEYPLVNQCVDGDSLFSESSYTSPISISSKPFNSSDCIDAYSGFTRCGNCYHFNGLIWNCDGGAQPIQYYKNECEDASQHSCPFCYEPGSNSLTNRYLMQKGVDTYGPPYRTDPFGNTHIGYEGNLGCGCDGHEVNCGAYRGQCSDQVLYTYTLGFQRTCSGIDATITVLFSTRTDFNAQDFPVMGGFVAAYQPTGLSMDATSFQIAVYPYTSFS